MAATDQDRSSRRFSTEDRNYILDAVRTNLDYWSESRRLNAVLIDPVTAQDFAEAVSETTPRRDDRTLSEILQEIVARFKERWPDAEKVEGKTVSSVMMEKNNDE